MPIQLRVHTAGPLNDRVSTDRIVEGSDEHVRASCLSGADRFIHIRDQIACTLQAEWIRDGRLEAEHGHRPHWRQDQLRHRAALGRSYGEDSLLARCSAKCRKQAGDETIEIFRSHVDMCRVVLRRHSHAYGSGCLRSLGEITGVRKSNDYTERQN